LLRDVLRNKKYDVTLFKPQKSKNMKAPIQYDRQVLALNDSQLEQFVRDWMEAKKQKYVEVVSFTGSGDMGRDVVGFLSNKKHEGDWHNYQCKQYAKRLPTDGAMLEIGKILYYAHKGKFSVPTAYHFVTPRGVNRNLEKLIFNPSQFKAELIQNWDKFCANSIVDGDIINLTSDLQDVVNSFKFESISRIDLSNILNDDAAKPVLFKWFGADPGPAPRGSAPTHVETFEIPYINQLIDAYSARDGKVFKTPEEVTQSSNHGAHFASQRERFYDADAFKRFYRDNTNEAVIRDFEADILSGVQDTCGSTHADALACVNAVMSQAATVQAAGPLAPHARVPVKQGICHHFVNQGNLKWQK
jgi:hypothetical protein